MHKLPFNALNVTSADLDCWFNVSGIFETQHAVALPDSDQTGVTTNLSFIAARDPAPVYEGSRR